MIPEKNPRDKKKCTISFLIVLAGIVLSCVTAFFGYDILPDYQDKVVHLRRIAALADTLKAGYFPARIYFAMNQGTGYAMPVFYPDINFYLPALLHIAGLSLDISYTVYVVIANVLTAVISYFCIKGFLYCVREENGECRCDGAGCGCIPAAVASFLYTLSVYRLTNVYIRDAAGEYTAMIFLPLVIYGFVRVYTEPASEKRSPFGTVRCALPLGAGMAILACSHVLTTMVVTALLSASAIVFFKKTFSGKVLGRLAVSVLIFAGLSAFALIPMIDLMRSDTYLVNGSSYIMRGFYPGWRELLELIPSGSGSGIAYELRMPTAIGAALIAVLFAYAVREMILFVTSVRKKSVRKFFSPAGIAGIYLFLLAGAVLFVSSKYFPWTYIESRHDLLTAMLCSIQFSWRYIGIATVLTVFLGSVLIRSVMKKKRSAGIALSMLLAVLALIPALVLECRACAENRHARIGKGSEIGIVSDELYFPVSWNRDLVYDRVPVADGAAVESFEINDYRWTVSVSSEGGEGTVIFPVVYYKGYVSVTGDGKHLETYQGEDGRVVTVIPAGFSGSFVMKYSEPVMWRVSEVVTVISFILICIMMHINVRSAGPSEKEEREVSSSD